MKKILCCLALLFALTACSMNDVIALLVTPTVPPPAPPARDATLEPTQFVAPSQTPTGTQIPTFTFTPTLIGGGEPFDAPTQGTTVLPTLVLVPTSTPGPQVTFNTSPGSVILSISVSSDTLYWGYCDAPEYIDFDVRVAKNPRLVYVLLFLRLVDKGGNQSTGWGAGAILSERRDGTYTYRITPEHLIHYQEFQDAWIEYQVVASRGGSRILESSPVYERSLSLQKCLPVEVDE